MRRGLAVLGAAVVLTAGYLAAQAPSPVAGVSLANLSWVDAEPYLTPASIVVIPLGSGALEQGPHLKLNSDERLARYLASRLQAAASVVIAPPLTYAFHPEFVEYPGTASLTRATAQALTVDVVRGLAKHGPRRFYVLNTEPAALAPLSDAAKTLADAGILLGYTDPRYRLQPLPAQLRQPRILKTHADEIATSMMLFVDPSAVDMKRAVSEFPSGSGVLTRQEGGPGLVSKWGVLGDATLATREKGQVLVEMLVAGALSDVEAIRNAPLPLAKPVTAPAPPPPAPPALAPSERQMASGCTAGQERDIRLIGQRFGSLWRQMDALKISELFAASGDMRHPDGTIERGPEVIFQNRVELFRKKEYRGSVHSVQLNDIRCFPSSSVAIADGRWDLRVAESGGVKPYMGWCTLVLRSSGGSWSIEAWRYTVDPPANTTPAPTILKKPGWPGGPGG